MDMFEYKDIKFKCPYCDSESEFTIIENYDTIKGTTVELLHDFCCIECDECINIEDIEYEVI